MHTASKANEAPVLRNSRLALTDNTDAILRPVKFKYDEPPNYCDVQLSGEFLRLFFYRQSGAGGMYEPDLVVARDFIQRFPESKPLDSKGVGTLLQVPATDTSAIILLEAWPKKRLFPRDEETRLVLQMLYARVFAQTHTLQQVAGWREKKGTVTCDFVLHPDFPLVEYQQVALNCSIGVEGYGLGMEQGTGKTPIAIARVCNEAAALRDTGESRMYRALVICPKTVQLNWQYEFERFGTHPGRVTVVRGDKIARVKLLADSMRVDPDTDDVLDEYTVVVASWDMLARTWQALKMIPWDLVIYDESHYAKDSKTTRFKYAAAIRDNARQRMVLTGTAIGNSALDLYSQFELMGQGYSGFTSFAAFKRFYAVYDKSNPNGQQGFAKLIAIQNMPFIQERLARTWFIIRKAEALPDLPKKVYDICEVELTEEQADMYAKLQNTLLLKIEDELSGSLPKQLVINNILTQLLRLAEITSGYVRFDEVYDPITNELLRPQLIDRFDPNPKLEQIVEFLRDKTEYQKTIIWACFVENIKTIRARLEVEGVDCVTYYGATRDKDREIAVKRFNCDHKCKVFVGNPAAGGIGLNLIGFDRDDRGSLAYQTDCDHEIFFSQNWSALVRSQSEDRAHRPQTRVPIRITDLVVPKSVDEEIRCRVVEKLKHSLEVSDLRDIVKRVLETRL